jgi:hypothetical protein
LSEDQARAVTDAADSLDALSDLSVFLLHGSSQAVREELRSSLEADPDIVGVRFISREEAFEDAQEAFADDPLILEDLSAEFLPESFIADVRDDADVFVVADRVSGFVGVDHAVPQGAGVGRDDGPDIAADRLILAWRADDRVEARQHAASEAVADLFEHRPPTGGAVAVCDAVAEDLVVCAYRLGDGRAVSVVTLLTGAGWVPAGAVVQ